MASRGGGLGRRGNSPVMKHRPESLRNSGSKQRMNHKLPAKETRSVSNFHAGEKEVWCAEKAVVRKLSAYQ